MRHKHIKQECGGMRVEKLAPQAALDMHASSITGHNAKQKKEENACSKHKHTKATNRGRQRQVNKEKGNVVLLGARHNAVLVGSVDIHRNASFIAPSQQIGIRHSPTDHLDSEMIIGPAVIALHLIVPGIHVV